MSDENNYEFKSNENVFGRKKKNLSIFISQKKCIGCEHCVGVCSKKVIGMIYKNEKAYASIEYKDRCTVCRVCEMLCPVDAIEIIRIK